MQVCKWSKNAYNYINGVVISSGQPVTYPFKVLIPMASFSEQLHKHIRKNKSNIKSYK